MLMDVFLFSASQEMQPILSKLAYHRVRPETTLLQGQNMQVRNINQSQNFECDRFVKTNAIAEIILSMERLLLQNPIATWDVLGIQRTSRFSFPKPDFNSTIVKHAVVQTVLPFTHWGQLPLFQFQPHSQLIYPVNGFIKDVYGKYSI